MNREIKNAVEEREKTIREKNREVDEVLGDYGILGLKEKHNEIQNELEEAEERKEEVENKFYRALGIMMSENEEQMINSNRKISSEGEIVGRKHEEKTHLPTVVTIKDIKSSLIDICESEYKNFIHNIIDYISSFSDDLHSLFVTRSMSLSKSNSQSSNSYDYNIESNYIAFSSSHNTNKIPRGDDKIINLSTYKNDDLQKLFSHKKNVSRLLEKTHKTVSDVIAKLKYVIHFIMKRFQNRMVAEEI